MPTLLGRQREREALEDLLEGLQSGNGWAPVVCDEAGAGKAAPFDCVVTASDLWALRAIGVESDNGRGFAGVHPLCFAVLDCLERLPVPQCDALRVAPGVRGGGAPDRFLVGWAGLTLPGEEAEQRYLLVRGGMARRRRADVVSPVGPRAGVIAVADESGRVIRRDLPLAGGTW